MHRVAKVCLWLSLLYLVLTYASHERSRWTKIRSQVTQNIDGSRREKALTWPQGKQLEVSILVQPNSLPSAYIKLRFTSSEHDLQETTSTPSCQDPMVHLMDSTNHIQEFTHVRSPNRSSFLIHLKIGLDTLKCLDALMPPSLFPGPRGLFVVVFGSERNPPIPLCSTWK